MGDSYNLKIRFKNAADIKGIIKYFLDRKFKYFPDTSWAEDITSVNTPLDKLDEKKLYLYTFYLINKIRKIYFLVFISNDSLTVSMSRVYLEKRTKAFLKEFICFIKSNYVVEEMKEVMGCDEKEYPFVLREIPEIKLPRGRPRKTVKKPAGMLAMSVGFTKKYRRCVV